jgi:hypothetical protein
VVTATLPTSDGRPVPFAIGVLALPTSTGDADRIQERLAVSMTAYKHRHFMVDVIEIDRREGLRPQITGYAALRALAEQVDADAIFIRGPVDIERIERMATEIRMMVYRADN